MTKLRCCFCQQELKDQWLGQNVAHEYFDCPKCKMNGNPKLWQELIRTHKTLEQSEICCTEWEKQALDYKAENIALSGDLERTRKVLEIAVDALKSADEYYMYCAKDKTLQNNAGLVAFGMDNTIAKALEQITALEQKK